MKSSSCSSLESPRHPSSSHQICLRLWPAHWQNPNPPINPFSSLTVTLENTIRTMIHFCDTVMTLVSFVMIKSVYTNRWTVIGGLRWQEFCISHQKRYFHQNNVIPPLWMTIIYWKSKGWITGFCNDASFPLMWRRPDCLLKESSGFHLSKPGSLPSP